tara:strand:- start:2386 stop:2712 length:327 start_codon:yes stop_codon:yes gene_type:complete
MRKKYTFRQPLGKDLNGLYITAAQMQFFLNRRGGELDFLEGKSTFFEYFYKCAVYNIVWDLLEEDPACATLYWDEDLEAVAIKFPMNGKVIAELKGKKVDYFFDEDYS